MAITNLEQLKIVGNEISPESYTLLEMVHQAAYDTAIDFHINHKLAVYDTDIEDELVNPDARAYATKILSSSRNAYKLDGAGLERLRRACIIFIGDQVGSLNAIKNATDEQWSAFISSIMINVFESMGGVLPNEKSEYEAL